jgi:hypothetical protein
MTVEDEINDRSSSFNLRLPGTNAIASPVRSLSPVAPPAYAQIEPEDDTAVPQPIDTR